MNLALHPAIGCVLQIAELSLSPSQSRWEGALHLELAANGRCAYTDLLLPAGVVLGKAKARQRLGDGTGARLGEERWEQTALGTAGISLLRLHTPELLGGDRVVIDLELGLPQGELAFTPGPANYVVLTAHGGTVNETGKAAGGERVWSSDTPPGIVLVARPAGAVPSEGSEGAPILPAGNVRVERQMILRIPPGDPQIHLFPGGGSSVAVADHLVFQPSEGPRAWPLSAPASATVQVKTEPPDMAKVVVSGPVPVLVVEPSEGLVRAMVSWEAPDAPTHGEKDPSLSALVVQVDHGQVDWDGTSWVLSEANDRPVVPPREILIGALDHRFREAAIPEPGAPMELRGKPASWETASLLRPALLDRVAIGDWPTDPLWARKLVRARKGAALTPTEAALTLWLYARQLQLDASWVLVRPASSGKGSSRVPEGFDRALVRIVFQGETRFIDPTCVQCAPFELPPDLQGARALGREIERTPDLLPGRHEVVVGEDSVRWHLEGPPALLLRQALSAIAPEARTQALASWMGGPGASLVELKGMELAGEPIDAVSTRGDGLIVDPLNAPPPALPAGTVWFDWTGTRTISWADHDVPDATLSGKGASYTRTHKDGRLVETLQIDQREVDGALMTQVGAMRLGQEEAVSRPPPSPSPP